jgi:autotransporter passenger strand-loop-strand repeat protein
VDPSGKNIFQLGGTGSGTFNLSSIGSSAQYRGFTTLDVVGGVWTVSGVGAATSGWHIDGGTMQFAGGAPLIATTVSGAGRLVVEPGAVTAVTLVEAGGTEVIDPGGSAFNTTVLSGGAIQFVSGSTASANLSAGAILEFGAGETFIGVIVSSGAILEFLDGGSDTGGAINSGGVLIVRSPAPSRCRCQRWDCRRWRQC